VCILMCTLRSSPWANVFSHTLHEYGFSPVWVLKNTLHRHVKGVHIGETVHACTICGKKYKYKETLTVHRKVHFQTMTKWILNFIKIHQVFAEIWTFKDSWLEWKKSDCSATLNMCVHLYAFVRLLMEDKIFICFVADVCYLHRH
jgi:hypothetical protein